MVDVVLTKSPPSIGFLFHDLMICSIMLVYMLTLVLLETIPGLVHLLFIVFIYTLCYISTICIYNAGLIIDVLFNGWMDVLFIHMG